MSRFEPIEWIPIDEAEAFVERVNWMCPRRDQTAWKYLELRIDTRDNHCTVWADSDRHSERTLIPAEVIRSYMSEEEVECGFSQCCKCPVPEPEPEPAKATRRVLPAASPTTANRADMRSRIDEMRKRDAGGQV